MAEKNLTLCQGFIPLLVSIVYNREKQKNLE